MRAGKLSISEILVVVGNYFSLILLELDLNLSLTKIINCHFELFYMNQSITGNLKTMRKKSVLT